MRKIPMTTNELAAAVRCAPQSIRAALCRYGHFHGLRPLKMPSGKLLWPTDSLTRLAAVAQNLKPAQSERGRKNSGLAAVHKHIEAPANSEPA